MRKYQIIYADPPWNYNKGVYQDGGRDERLLKDQYSVMSYKELKDLSVNKITDDNCGIFLWVTDSHLKKGIELMETWGFTYRTIAFIWKKITSKGNLCANVGAWTMKNCEVCLYGSKGNMLQYKRVNNIYQIVEAERTKHSRKPDEVRNRINRMFNGLNKIELFAREEHEGWDNWGNCVDNDIEL